MSEYKLKTGKVGRKATDLYDKIEDGTVSAYRAVEDAVERTYRKIEDKFVDTFLEKVDDEESVKGPSKSEMK